MRETNIPCKKIPSLAAICRDSVDASVVYIVSNTQFEVILDGVWRCSAILEDYPSMNEKDPKNLITTRKYSVYKASGAYKYFKLNLN